MSEVQNQTGPFTAPKPLALIVCDHVHRDGGSGKYTLLGTFSMVFANKFPASHQSIAIFIAVTDGRGTVPTTIKLIDLNEERPPVLSITGTIRFDDPTQVIEQSFVTPTLQFPEPGDYRLQMLAGDELIMERRIMVVPRASMERRAEGQGG